MAYINGKPTLFSPHINITGGDTTELEEQIADLTAENTELKAQNAELEETVSNLVATNNELMQDVANADAYGEQLEAELEDAHAYIEELETRIEELEGGGNEPTDQTALAGAYENSTYTTREYTWDEMAARNNYGDGDEPFFDIDKEFLDIYASGYAVVVPDDVVEYDICFDCAGIVIPATTKHMYGGTINNKETIYVKATVPPVLSGEIVGDEVNVVVPIGCGDAYKSATGWCNYFIEEGEMPI